MKVLFVSPEVNPIVRTGGLGDVVGSLPLALHALGVDVRVICPKHRYVHRSILKNIKNLFFANWEKNLLKDPLWNPALVRVRFLFI